ncbi:transposase, partial [Gulosibacter sediminis]|uniref:transposase n=1 Tax=Gulosibacter sediminis TaxID=1729695 RepID=UPI00186950A5
NQTFSRPQHQLAKLEDVFDQHPDDLAVEIAWDIYQRAVACYRHKDPARGKKILEAVIAGLTSGVPKDLPELISLGRTITRRAADVLAFFDHPGTSNGPSEAINGRLEHLRGTALGFRNLTHY